MSENKVVYSNAAGGTATFYFNFLFFHDDEVVVSKNDRMVPAGQYSLQKNAAGAAADYPYEGGSVTFAAAPAAKTKITIERRLRIERSIDYQPMARIQPATLNRDLNFFMECAKEFDRRLASLRLLENFNPDEISARIEAICELLASLEGALDFAHASDLPPITGEIAAISSALAALEGQVADLPEPPAQEDYVIAESDADADPWYRKWSSGFVEQGGTTDSFTNTAANSSQTKMIALPVEMANLSYRTQLSIEATSSGWSVRAFNASGKTTESFGIVCFNNAAASGTENNRVVWTACGLAA
ncbi:MAG: hypothetical protein LBL21_02355 [Rickettsiales bacterium]|jgi:hypothetical protein|nr:hypothetical protein [Rickettsiales bacterium]